MENSRNDQSPEFHFSVDAGNGREADVELTEAGGLWILCGAGFKQADLWLNGVTQTDVKVGVTRSEQGIEVALHTKAPGWWPEGGEPRLYLAFHGNRTVTAYARVGPPSQIQEVLLGMVTI